MKIGDAHKLVTKKHPRIWTPDDQGEFLKFVDGDGHLPERESKLGEKFHLARSYADFRYFCSKTMDYGWKLKRNPQTGVEQYYGFIFGDPDWPAHDQMINMLLSEYERIILLAPRGSYKTTLLALYCVWLIGKNPDIRIMYAMHVLSKAKQAIGSMMLEMQREEYIEVFGKMRPPRGEPRWSVEGVRVKQCERTSKEATLTPGGIDSEITGDHQDLIILDDPVSEKNTRSRDLMLKTYEWTKNLEPIVDPGCRIADVGTRWHHADAHGMLMKENEEITEETLKWRTLVLSAERPDGSPYVKHLDDVKLNAAKAKGSFFYSCQYLNNPVSTEEQLFFSHQFKIIKFSDVPRTTFRYLLIDTAATKKRHSSMTAIWCVAVDAIENVYGLDLQMGKWKPDEVLNRLYGMWMKWDPRWATMEANVHGKVYKSYISTQNKIRQLRMTIRELYGRNERSKDDRIVGLQPLFEYSRIFFADSIPWEMIHDDGGDAAGAVVDEFITFPKGATKDAADALSDVLASDKDGKACPPYKMKQSLGQIPQGPNLTTVTGRFPDDVFRRAQQLEGRFKGRGGSGGGRYTGRPTGKKLRGRPQ